MSHVNMTIIDLVGTLWPHVEAANGTVHLVANWYVAIAANEAKIRALREQAVAATKKTGWWVSDVYRHEFNIQRLPEQRLSEGT